MPISLPRLCSFCTISSHGPSSLQSAVQGPFPMKCSPLFPSFSLSRCSALPPPTPGQPVGLLPDAWVPSTLGCASSKFFKVRSSSINLYILPGLLLENLACSILLNDCKRNIVSVVSISQIKNKSKVYDHTKEEQEWSLWLELCFEKHQGCEGHDLFYNFFKTSGIKNLCYEDNFIILSLLFRYENPHVE